MTEKLPNNAAPTSHEVMKAPALYDHFYYSKTAKDLEWELLTSKLAAFAQTTRGVELACDLVPFDDQNAAEARFQKVAEVNNLIENEQLVPLAGLKDARQIFSRAAIGARLDAIEIAAIAQNCDIFARIQSFFARNSELAPILNELAQLIDSCTELRSALSHSIEPGGRISDYASPDLKSLRQAVHTQTERLREKVDSLLQDESLEIHLQDDYYTLREGRYVLPVRASSKTTVEGIIHGYSSSGQTAFIEPDLLVQANNRLRWAQVAVNEEETRILVRLTQLVSNAIDSLRKNMEIVEQIDLIVAIAKFSSLYQGKIPTLLPPPNAPALYLSTPNDAKSAQNQKKSTLFLQALKHPLLHIKFAESLEEGEENPNVSNDLRIEPERRVLVVSGPNTGGKTVLLKALGLAVLMAKAGIPVPAERATIPFYGGVYTDIGDEQSIQKDLSTFSSHLINIGGFLSKCGPNSLVLLDELFTGTDPMQGSALAAALLEELAKRGTTTLVTTHLESLKTIALHNDAFANASVGFDLNSLHPNYLLTLGVPGSSFALRIADRLGFPSEIVDHARRKLDQEGHLGVDIAMAKLEEQAEELRAETLRLQQQRRSAEAAEKKYKRKYDAISVRDRGIVHQRARQLQKELQQADKILRNQIKALSVGKELNRKDLEHIRETIRLQDKVIERVKAQTSKEVARPDGLLPVPPEKLEEGLEVYLLGFKRNGVVTHVDRSKKRAQVQIGVLKSYVDFGDIFYTYANRPEESPEIKDKRSDSGDDRGDVSPVAVKETLASLDSLLPKYIDNTVDLRGLSKDEAIEKLDLFIDAVLRSDINVIYIVHGFGGGVLRKAVRSYLASDSRACDFRAGERREGGDGVTIALVRSLE